jgi:uncharacterized protein YjaZ
MSHKTLTVFALVGALSFPAHPGIAQEALSPHQGQWPIQNGIKRQPTQNELKALHDRDVTPNDAREIDRLYDELMSKSFSETHHTGIARMR